MATRMSLPLPPLRSGSTDNTVSGCFAGVSALVRVDARSFRD